MSSDSRWIGVDLDGTLAEYDGWKGHDQIGDPIPRMLRRVRAWVLSGYNVRILTTRGRDYKHRKPVERWLARHGLRGLKVTTSKDHHMIALFDDRAVSVKPNTGEVYTLNESLRNLTI